jgi:hypothetical protein
VGIAGYAGAVTAIPLEPLNETGWVSQVLQVCDEQSAVSSVSCDGVLQGTTGQKSGGEVAEQSIHPLRNCSLKSDQVISAE